MAALAPVTADGRSRGAASRAVPDRRVAAEHRAPVVVVGNVWWQAAGKTPGSWPWWCIPWGPGLAPGVVSRGYGRSTKDCRAVHADSPAHEVGDEPADCPPAPSCWQWAVRPHRCSAHAQGAPPEIDVIVRDDGLQHLALARDVAICVFNDQGTGNGFPVACRPAANPGLARTWWCMQGPADVTSNAPAFACSVP